ncbi:TolC family protein [Pedobacter sp. MW01-1-1]|uniref:TolC family protein n=1 Tax=Pedobacter sp. MW01-1-1 TaxID=3383027 RepID=UPI003FF0758D
MHRVKLVTLMLVLFAGIVIPQLAVAQQQVTLKDALNYALQNNSNAKKAKMEIDRGKYKEQEVRAQALPQINATSGLTYNPIIGQQVVDFGGQTQVLKFGQSWNSNAGVQLQQQVFNQQVFTGLQAAKASQAYYSLNAELTDEQVIELVANNYYQVLVTREQLSVIDTNIKNVKVVQKIINAQYASGLTRKIDVDRINVNLTNLNTQHDQAVNAITVYENQLKFSMGMPVSTAIELPKAELTGINSLPNFPDSVPMSARTEIKLLDVQKRLYELQRKAYVSEYYPTLALSANYTYSSQSNSFDYLRTGSNAIGFGASAVGLTLRVPIFNGFSTRSKVRQANVDLLENTEDRIQLTNSLNLAYENAKIQLRNSLNTITLQRKNADLAEEIYRSTQNNYNNGLASFNDLLETENSLTAAKNSLTQALLNYKIAELQLIKSNGNLKSLLN